MARKEKTDGKPADDDRDAAGAGAADDAGAAGAGQAAAAAGDAAEAAAQPAAALDAGAQPGAADAGAHAPDAGADEGEAAEAGNGAWGLNVERATFAASHAFGGDGSFAGYTVDDDSLDLPEHLRLMEAAAAFVRVHPDAPAEAVPVEIGLKGFRDLPETGPRELAAWRVFAFTLHELDRLDADLAARAEAATAPPAAPPAAYAGVLALMPLPPAFSPTGFTPRR